MKKIGLFLFITLCTSIGRSQTYAPFPDSGGRWVNTVSTLESNGQGGYYCVLSSATNYCTNGSDTIINSKSYFKLTECQGGYKGAVRNDSGKVFFVPRDSLSEFLLYDFTADPGDTIQDVIIDHQGSGSYGLYDLPVDGVDSIKMNGDYRKILYVKGGKWIEGIGNSKGLFLEPWACVCPYCFDLHCMSENDTTLHPTLQTDSSCALDVGIESQHEKGSRIHVHPNPVKNGPLQVTLPPNLKMIRYKLYDPRGRLLKMRELEGGQIALPDRSGVYILKFYTEQGPSIHKVLVP